MLKFLSAFRRFLTAHKVAPATAQKVAERILNKMNRGAELTGDEMRLGALYIQLGDIKGKESGAEFLKDAIGLGYTEVEWTYALAPGKTGHRAVEWTYSKAPVAGARRGPAKFSPAASGYTEVEWTYHKTGARLPDVSGISAMAEQVASA